MAEFTYPPLTPDPDPSPLSPMVPLNPPMVGEVSPFDHVDGQNRDIILEAIRAWIRGPLRSWTTAWQTYLVYWLALVAAWLNTFVTEADEYITEHAIAGYSWRTTVTPIAASGTTTVVLTVDTNLRPLVIGDLVSDQEPNTRYGIITALVDATHATVSPLGVLQGNTGYGWWVTVTAISASGTTDVVLPVETDRVPQVGDLVSDESSALRYGQITAVSDATHATVTPLGVLRGLAGFGWWTTATTIVHSGTTAVVIGSGPDRLPQVNDLVVDESSSSAYGEVTVVTDATHVTVAFVGTLQGPAGSDGTDGTDGAPGAPGADGVVQSITGSSRIYVNSADPAHPALDVAGQVVFAVVAGSGVTVDDSDPQHPVVAATGGGGGTVDSIVAGTNITVDDTDPANPIVSATGLLESVSNGDGSILIDDTDPANPIISAGTITGIGNGSGPSLSFASNPGSHGDSFGGNFRGFIVPLTFSDLTADMSSPDDDGSIFFNNDGGTLTMFMFYSNAYYKLEFVPV